ncbi:hypothetical protein ACH47B_21695 [Rhodococcus sp. NPDC019627]|uniref:hypothetical protein n=1 Tax=unclassified Rhodococcus (in: high G+C Gram-positive bacteria) TaxID=192944 RepID=UPI0037921B75
MTSAGRFHRSYAYRCAAGALVAHRSDDVTAEQAQRRVDEFSRMRATADGKASVATVAPAEP